MANRKFLVVLLLVLFAACFNVFSQITVEAEIANNIYKPGDYIDVQIKVEGSPGLHGMFFYLNYDRTALQLEEVEEGLMINRVKPEKELLYAVGEDRIITAFTLTEPDTETLENGVLAVLRFKAIAASSPDVSYNFSFSNTGIRDIDKDLMTGVTWENSRDFYIYDPDAPEYMISINNPSDFDVVYDATADLDLTFTTNSAYYITIENEDTGFVSPHINAWEGHLEDYAIGLRDEYNRIFARLYDENDEELAEHSITLIKSGEDKFIRIDSPEDHALVNTNMVLVTVESTFADPVVINDVTADVTDENVDGIWYSNKRVWLKEGFNTITAETVVLENGNYVHYEDEIVVYYEKALDTFRFLRPYSGELIKTKDIGDDILLNIIGEISSRYKNEKDLNTVTLRVVYDPDNPVLSNKILVNNELAEITEMAGYLDDAQAPYMFHNKTNINITGLSGRIDIIAYLNKNGENSDEAIIRTVYVSNEKLWIDLIKPHIYSSDYLDTNYKISGFNEGDLTSDTINIYNGIFSLKENTSEIKPVTGEDLDYDYIQDMIELADGTVYALLNYSPAMEIWKKEFGSNEWELVIHNKNMYGYTLCETGMGILVGVSNKFNPNKSGLYFLKEEDGKRELVNIRIGEPIIHVQFIKNFDGTIYLYGDNYSHLFSFYLYSLQSGYDEEEEEYYYTAIDVNNTKFDNELFIKDFILSSSLDTAVILTVYGKALFYQKDPVEGYLPVEEINSMFESEMVKVRGISIGEYESGGYNSYLLYVNFGVLANIMEDKETGELTFNVVNKNIDYINTSDLMGFGFKDNCYYFLSKSDELTYELKKAKMFFDSVYEDTFNDGDEYKEFSSGDETADEIDTEPGSYKLLITNRGMYYQGIGRNLMFPSGGNDYENVCTELYNVTEDEGTISFKYKNDDIDALMGFSFTVDPIWLPYEDEEEFEEYLKLDFKVRDSSTDEVIFPKEDFATFEEFLNTESDYYKINRYYDADMDKEIISIDFTELQRGRYIDFDINLIKAETSSPVISGLTVYKKVKVKIPRGEEETVLLPVKGYVYDPTVSDVHINEKTVPIMSDSSFSHNYEIKSSAKEKLMKIWCENKNGETVNIDFIVQIFDSTNDIADITFRDALDTELTVDSGTLVTETENIKVSGNFFGLNGAVAGYELYYYEYDDEGEEVFIPVSRGIFDTSTDTANNDDLEDIFGTTLDSTAGYIIGEFEDQEIKTYPGVQQIRLFVENPGGKRQYFMFEDNHIDINYALPDDQQKIIIVNEEVEEFSIRRYDDETSIYYDCALPITVTDMYNMGSGEFKFKKKYKIYGEAKAFENIGDVLLRSYDDDVLFSNGEKEITISVDELNRFEEEITVFIPDEKTEENHVYKIAVIPVAHFWATELTTGVEIWAFKDFHNACIQPNFNFVETWNDEELETMRKKIELRFDRPIPENSTIDLMLNFEHEFTGVLVKHGEETGVYFLQVDSEDDEQIYLENVKIGTNRLQWVLKYNDRIINFSSNWFNEFTPRMPDKLFDVNRPDFYNTKIDFLIDENKYYDNTNDTEEDDIPLINITKEKATKIIIKLNDYPIWEKDGIGTNFEDLSIYNIVSENTNLDIETLLKEGKNKVTFWIQESEDEDDAYTIERELLYDSKYPEVLLGGYKFVDVNNRGLNIYISEFSAIVKEANIRETDLIYDESIISDVNCTVTMSYLGDDQYKVTFSGLENQDPLVKPFRESDIIKRVLYVRIIDHTGKSGRMEDFEGITSPKVSELADAKMIDISSAYYERETPPEGIELHDDHGNGTYAGRLRFYNDTIERITDLDLVLDRPFGLYRTEEVRISGSLNIPIDRTLRLKSNGRIAFTVPDPGERISMEDTTDDSLQGRIEFDTETIVPESKLFPFSHDVTGDRISMAFLFRQEKHPDYTFNDTTTDQEYFRVLTFYYEDQDNINQKSVYLAYTFNPDGTQYYFTLVKETETGFMELGNRSEAIDVTVDPDWHTILLTFYQTEDEFISDQIIFTIDNYRVEYNYVQDPDHEDLPGDNDFIPAIINMPNYFFGSTTNAGFIISDDEEVGNFSITNPFYIDQIITSAEIGPYMTAVYGENGTGDLPSDDSNRFYDFDDTWDDYGNEEYHLIYYGYKDFVYDWFEREENVDNNEDSGALKGSSKHKNYLNKITNAVDKYPVFVNSNNIVMENLLCTPIGSPGDDDFRHMFYPANLSKPGKYFFSTNLGNHGLKKDANGYYSISGTVVDLADRDDVPNAKLCLRINGVQQEYELTEEGEFHFVFDGRNVGMPSEVILYLETYELIVLDYPLVFTEGNYEANKMTSGFGDYDFSYAVSQYSFQPTGTINLWYKPFQVNKQGYVNYETVIFDSNYIKIYTKKEYDDEDNKKDYTIYMAELKMNSDTEDDVVLKSCVPVQGGWHNIQVSYDGVDGLAYLYIDGDMVAKKEDGIPDVDTAASNTIYLGCNMNQTIFAEGFIDNVTINAVYNTSLYSEGLGTPFHVEYQSEPGHSLNFVENGLDISDIDYISYTLESLDGEYRKSIYDTSYREPMDISDLKPGSYMLKTKIKAEYRYENVCSFTIDDLPRIILKDDYTALIMNGVNTDIGFNILFDDAYLLKKKESKYAGFGIRLSGFGEDGSGTRTYVALQGYKDKDFNKWYIRRMGDDDGSEDIEIPGKTIPLIFEDITTNENDLDFDIRPFYHDENIDGQFFPNLFNFEDHEQQDGLNGVIPAGDLVVEKGIYTDENDVEYEYKLNISVGASGSSNTSIYDRLSIDYEFTHENGEIVSDTIEFKGNDNIDLFFDDAFGEYYGNWSGTVKLMYERDLDYRLEYSVEEIDVEWKEIKDRIQIEGSKTLEIVTFSLLDLDKEKDKAQVYLEIFSKNLEDDINYGIFINDETTDFGDTFSPIDTYTVINLENIPKGSFIVTVRVSSTSDEYEYVKEEELNIVNNVEAPRVVMTNTVESLIGYNNVLFTWVGQHDGQFKEEIKYSYDFDGKGWSAPTSQQRKIEFYNLSQGWHTLLVKAEYMQVESQVETVRFFVDVENPVITPKVTNDVGEDTELIYFEPEYDPDGFLISVNIIGKKGAVTDEALESLYINGDEIEFNLEDDETMFAVYELPIIYDGNNPFKISAVDRVGNYSEYTVNVDNTITNIIFPKKHVRYSPMSIVGQIVYTNKTVGKVTNEELEISVKDPQIELKEDGDISHWKKAKINEDRVFFIENVYVNPGTEVREAHTPLLLAVKTKYGKIYYKEINVRANSIVRPIDMELSAHAVEGQNADREITISCKANVDNIASWSIDFTGDGIYDNIVIVDNPALGMECEWTHVYSTLGLANPRVRIITLDGNFFSVSDQLVVHEKIKDAKYKAVSVPIAMDSIKLEDNTEYVYVLEGEDEQFCFKVYEMPRNDEQLILCMYDGNDLSLEGLGINNPEKIAVLDKDHIYIASNQYGTGSVFVLKADELNGNYFVAAQFDINNEIKSMDVNDDYIYITSKISNYVARVKIENKLPLPETLEYLEPEILHDRDISTNLEITKDVYGVLISDYYNQRVVRLTDSCNVVEYFGEQGTGESEFINPSYIVSHENRIFVYDETRKDIQVFDKKFKPVTRIRYDEELGDDDNYLPEGFLDDLGGMSIVTRVENNRLYYYAIMLSKSTGSLAMIRLPQWEELRARVRSNKIIFLNNKEVFTAKPSGGDLAKILSSDSIPKIEGKIDYPSISPDGRTIVFTSRVELYDGTGNMVDGGSPHAYDNLYIVDIDGENLTRIPLGTLNNYEIERPVFNSNGDKIIFSAKPTGGLWQIYIYDRKTGGVENLFEAETGENARFPYYSPNDRFVVFVTDYDGDKDIAIVDTRNTSVRTFVTKNNARDSLPVWNRTYPFELDDDDVDKGVNTKIAYVSERDGHKGVYYSYILINPDADDDIHIYDVVNGDIEDENPDEAAIEVTYEYDPETEENNIVEGDYPCFTGDGKALVYEYNDGFRYVLKKCDFEINFETDHIRDEIFAGDRGFILEDMNLTETARRPAGMKNMITNFTTEIVHGNQIKLTWDRYTDNESSEYHVEYQKNVDDELGDREEKTVYGQNNILLTGREMGAEYIIRVYMEENGEEVATSTWEVVKMPVTAARPTVTINDDNPYIVDLDAWKPSDDTTWNFTWIIDNQPQVTTDSPKSSYEFATSGTKYIKLRVQDTSNGETSESDPIAVEIKTDIVPVITYELKDEESGNKTLHLSSADSFGEKIKSGSTEWIISGPGLEMQKIYTGETTNVDVGTLGMTDRVYVTLRLTRETVIGQASTDIIETTRIIPLEYEDLAPVITTMVDEDNPRIITFMADDSIGNIDWLGTKWIIYADGEAVYDNGLSGGSSIVYQFPENTSEKTYTVALTLKSLAEKTTKTVTQIVSIEPCEMEPVIDYEILDENGDENLKLVLTCTGSKGNNIDYSRTVWTIPADVVSGESHVQVGPTAVFALMNLGERTFLDVSLTLTRRGGTDTKTYTQRIMIDATDYKPVEMVVNIEEEQGSSGAVLVFDVLDSKGPDILWDKTTWQFNGQMPITFNGPVARYDVSASGDDNIIRYVCSIYRQGKAEPIVKTGEFNVKSRVITPVINTNLRDRENNVFEIDALQSQGMNIDWERTRWYVYDGNDEVKIYAGSKIMHAFKLREDAMGYSVMVEMFFKNDTTPFVGYKTIDVEGNEMVPVIKWDKEADREDEFVVHFSAHDSVGHNINWASSKWTFGDGSEVQYGATAVHKYPLSDTKKEYKVSLTLYRTVGQTEVESKVVYKTIRLDSDEVKPKIRAMLNNEGCLILSAEDTEGRGLMLDRSVWLFDGKGDNQSFNIATHKGTLERETDSSSSTDSYQAGYQQLGNDGTEMNQGARNVTTLYLGPTTTESNSNGTDVTDYSKLVDSTDSFTTSNMHTGAVCRRYVGVYDLATNTFGGVESVWVSLTVYRVTPDGGIVGRSIIREIVLEECKKGKIYE